MNNYINRSRQEQLELIMQTAAKLAMEPAAIEKDFWVCWILQRLFESTLRHSIIFKGGTSLSKVYGLIKRFSEDIDLILNWEDFRGECEWDPGERYGKASRKKMMDALDEWNARQIASSILPIVQKCCGGVCTAQIPEDLPEVISITYPKNCECGYIRPQILLEIGPKAAWNPHAEHTVRPYMAELYPMLFQNADASVVVTTAERAFWEKVTILHAQAKRTSKLPKRYARHYYDTVMMSLNADLKKSAYADTKLLYQVASFKYYFYRAGWADYPHAVPGTMHLMPGESILADLVVDYDNMRREMLPADAPSFQDILEEISLLQKEINQLTPLHLDITNYPSMECSWR